MDGSQHDKLQIYAVNSWLDIELSDYEGNVVNTGNLQPLMFCGDDYSELCVIADNVWNCVDDDKNSLCFVPGVTASPTIPTISPTSNPTVSPTGNNGDNGDNNESSEDWVLILLSILALLVFIVILTVLWLWCNNKAKQQQGSFEDKAKSPKREYQKLNTIDTTKLDDHEDENLNVNIKDDGNDTVEMIEAKEHKHDEEKNVENELTKGRNDILDIPVANEENKNSTVKEEVTLSTEVIDPMNTEETDQITSQ